MVRPVDQMTDVELAQLNRSHDWLSYTKDSYGRRVGGGDFYFRLPWGDDHSTDGEHPWIVTDADRRFGFRGKTVVEFGCFEGAWTVALTERGASVIAIEARDRNLEAAKTRCRAYGVDPTFLKMDVETEVDRIPEADIYFHRGVLYHLQDPAWHLRRISRRAPILIMDTCYAKKANELYRSKDGNEYFFSSWRELTEGAFSGIRHPSRWLGLGTLIELLNQLYYEVVVLDTRLDRRKVWRVTLFASGTKA